MDDGVEIVALGEAGEGIEEARIELGARHLAETDPTDVVGRERPRPADFGVLAVGLEPVAIAVAGLELLDVDGDRPVAVRKGDDGPGLPATHVDGILEPPGDRRLAALVGRDPGPDDHPVRQRIAARDPVLEDRPVGRIRHSPPLSSVGKAVSLDSATTYHFGR